MGKKVEDKARGVQIRPNSIRLNFSYEGKMRFPTLMAGGKPMKPTPANIAYAERLIVTIREKIRHGVFSMAEFFPDDGGDSMARSTTLGDQLDSWLDTQMVEQSTRNGYLTAIRFWKAGRYDPDRPNKRLGDVPLRALKKSYFLKAMTAHVARNSARLDEDDEPQRVCGKTLKNYLGVLHPALELAVDDGLLSANPAHGVKAPVHQVSPPDPFSEDESDKIIAYAQRRYEAQVWNLIEFWFWSGLRTSEIFGLRWRNVDFASGVVMIQEVRVRGKNKNRTKTKTYRLVRLNSRSMAALQRQRAHTQLSAEHVFHDPRYSRPWDDERAFRRSYWTRALAALGIRYRRPYNMRHSYATAMLMAGMKPAYCARQLGHSAEVFHRTYARWVDGQRDDQEMALLEKSIQAAHLPGTCPNGQAER